MPSSSLIKACQRRLFELGCPARDVGRMVHEIADHHQDLEHAALDEGLSKADAEVRADARIGDPMALAEELARSLRRSSWWGRHPFVSFCLLPPLGIVGSFAVGLAVFWMLWKLCLTPAQQAGLGGGAAGVRFIAVLVQTVYYTSILGVAVLFWWLARRSAVGFKWVVVACVICSLLTCSLYLSLVPHRFTIGLGFARDWPSVLIPVVVLGAALIWHRRMERYPSLLSARSCGNQTDRLIATLLVSALPLLSTGCAHRENKPVQQRGWIGGEYKAVKSGSGRLTSGKALTALPTSLKDHEAGILVTALSSNTPARLAGLCEGDLILELDHRPATELREFRRRIDQAGPGTVLAVKASRSGQTIECEVPVGRETFQNWGAIGLGLYTNPWDLWPDPGFSLVFLGYQPDRGSRCELGSVEATWARNCDSEGYRAVDEDWNAWLVVLHLSSQKVIVSQDMVQAKP